MNGRLYQFADLFSSHGDGSPVDLRDPRDPAYDPDKADAIDALSSAVGKRRTLPNPIDAVQALTRRLSAEGSNHADAR